MKYETKMWFKIAPYVGRFSQSFAKRRSCPACRHATWNHRPPAHTARVARTRGDGYADPENSDEAVQPDSIFAIASLSKAITATAVLRLVDEGRLNLDDPVFPMLNLPPPTFPGAQPDPRLTNITVRQCLNHTA